MLKIRLQRTGKKGQAYFRLVVTEHTVKPKGKYLELLGSYDPHKNTLKAKKDRVEYWLSKGAKLSETANNILVDRQIIAGEKVKAWRPKISKKSSSPVVIEKAEMTAKKEEPAVENIVEAAPAVAS